MPVSVIANEDVKSQREGSGNTERSNGGAVSPGYALSYRLSILSHNQVRALSAMYIPKYHLTVNTWKTLYVIMRDAPLSASQVASRCSLDRDKVTRAVEKLREQGLVNRREDEEDRRRVTLTVTAKGVRVFDDIEGKRRSLEKDLLSTLTKTEQQMLFSILDKLEARAHTLTVK